MSEDNRSSAAVLRHDFDRGFAESPREASSGFDGFLTMHLGDDAYLLPLADLAGLVADRRIVPLPTRAPHLIGVAGIRGVLTPIYDLAAILGYPAIASAPRWLALTRSRESVGLAFERFGGHLRTPRGPDSTAPEIASGSHVRGALRVADTLFRIVDIAVIVGEIEKSALSIASVQE